MFIYYDVACEHNVKIASDTAPLPKKSQIADTALNSEIM